MTRFEEEVTIAITVYDRRDYIAQAIDSALRQTLSVRVMVVEDCGPNLELQNFVRDKYGSRINYHRNEQRQGLFGNWNVCLDLCSTPYLSILHDDDFLEPDFVEAMRDLVRAAPGRGLYFGQAMTVNEKGEPLQPAYPDFEGSWRNIELSDFAKNNMVSFPGQLMPVKDAHAVGGFRKTSLYCGDVEMWVKLTARFGAAQTSHQVAFVRDHFAAGRGTSRVERTGKIPALLCVQQKRTAALRRAQGYAVPFDRREFLRHCPVPIKALLRSAHFYPQWLLCYNHSLLLQSTAPNGRYAVFQRIARMLGPHFLRVASKVFAVIRPP
jgi:hypothetical protein